MHKPGHDGWRRGASGPQGAADADGLANAGDNALTEAHARSAAWRRDCVVVFSLLALGGLLPVAFALQQVLQMPQAQAGEARSSFQVGIRILPRPQVDASAAAELAAIAATSAGTRAASGATTSESAASAPSAITLERLPRAGGGWCVKVARADGGVRWRCD